MISCRICYGIWFDALLPPQDTKNTDYDTIETCVVLLRGVELSALLEINLSPVNMDADTADEGNNMSVRGASIGVSPDGNITHQYASVLSLYEVNLYKRRLEEMNKGTTS